MYLHKILFSTYSDRIKIAKFCIKIPSKIAKKTIKNVIENSNITFLANTDQ